MKKPDSALSAAEMNDRLMRDAGTVIQRRLEIMAEAVCDPTRADLTELALMSDEKVAAFQAVSERATAGAGIVAGQSAWRSGNPLAQHPYQAAAVHPGRRTLAQPLQPPCDSGGNRSRCLACGPASQCTQR